MARPPPDGIQEPGIRRRRPTGVVWVNGIYIRQAVLGVLLSSGCALSIKEILERLEGWGVRIESTTDPHKVVSDLLRYQVRTGRVARLRRGLYRVEYLPPTTEWRLRQRIELRSWPWVFWQPEAPVGPGGPRVPWVSPPLEPPRWWLELTGN